jgi:hypothetical protein
MINLSSTYIDMLMPFFSSQDSTGLEEFISIFMPSENFVCRFREIMPDYKMHLEPLNTVANANSLLKIYIPQCVTDTVEDSILNDFSLEADMTSGENINFTDASSLSMLGLILGEDTRVMFNSSYFVPSDEAFIPVNILSALFLNDASTFPTLSGDLTCAFCADSSGTFSILDGSMSSLSSSLFNQGNNEIVFNDSTGFFMMSFDVDSPTLISDTTILFYPDDYSESFLTTYEMLSILNSTLYEVV